MYPCPHHASTLWSQDFYGRTVPLTSATPLPTFSVLATQRPDKMSGHPGDKEAHQQVEEKPTHVDLSPILLLMGSDIQTD